MRLPTRFAAMAAVLGIAAAIAGWIVLAGSESSASVSEPSTVSPRWSAPSGSPLVPAW